MQQNNSSAYLIIRQGTRWTDVYRLEPGRPLIIGRASSNEIPVPDDRSSRRHAEVFFDGQWNVRDLGSRNGTFVDGEKIEGVRSLQPGSLITVASCRMTFSHTLDQVAPPLEADDPSPETTQVNEHELAAITHRQSKSAILDPASVGISTIAKLGNPMSTPSSPIAAPAVELLQLAFELAREGNLNRGCEVALKKLLDATGCRTAGILKIETAPPFSRTVLATSQQAGKAYHPVSETLASSVLRDNAAVLARNIHHDANLNASTASAMSTQSSHIQNTTSAIVAPIRIGDRIAGMVHLYSRVGEPDLTPENLEVALTIAEVLSTFFDNQQRQESLEAKLKSSRHRISELEQQLGHGDDWVGQSPAMHRIREQVARVGPTQATVLLRGESGAGKEVVARAIHQASTRASGPFVALNCAALTPTLLESELFGHEKGAFTGATDRKLGKFEQAHTGTIMLDELGEMSLEIQAKFLRILEGKPFERVGGNKPIQVDVRVIAATNKDLELAVKDGHFRSDLYFRLRVIELRIPPLRERKEEIVALAKYFLEQFRTRSGHGPVGFSQRAIDAMLAYHWPGNVRELRNSVERAYVLSTGELAEPEDLALSYLQVPGLSFPSTSPTESAGPSSHADASISPVFSSTSPQSTVYRERSLEDVESEHIAATLEYTGGQKNRAAAILGIERSTLDRKLKRNKNEPA